MIYFLFVFFASLLSSLSSSSREVGVGVGVGVDCSVGKLTHQALLGSICK